MAENTAPTGRMSALNQHHDAVIRGNDLLPDSEANGTDHQNLPLRPRANGVAEHVNHDDGQESQHLSQASTSSYAKGEEDDLEDQDYGIASNVPPAEEKKKKKKSKTKRSAGKRGLVRFDPTLI